jgi:acetyl esterase
MPPMNYLVTYPELPHVPLDARIAADLRARADATPFYRMPPSEGRAAFDALMAGAPKLNDAVARIEDRIVPAPALDVSVRVYTPQGAGPFPILVYIHGGGWVIGSRDSHDDLCRSLCHRAGALVVSVDYRRSPEHKFPAALEDCYAVLSWCARQPPATGDGRRLAVAGDSAGGNLSAALALYARDKGGPPLRLQVLIYPVTNYGFDTASYHENAEGFGLMRAAMIHYWNCYLATPADGQSGYASPLQAADLRGLPPALIQTAQYDVLRDDGEAYAARLHRAGVPVRCTRYAAMNHGFVQFGAAYEHGRVGVQEIADALREAFGR